MMSPLLILATMLAVQPTAADLVAAYQQSTHVLDRAEFELDCTDALTGDSRMHGIIQREATYHIWRDGTRWKIDCQSLSRVPTDGGKFEVEHHTAQTLSGQTFLQVDGLDSNQSLMAYLDGAPQSIAIGWLDTFAVLFGYLPGNNFAPTPELLRQATSSITPVSSPRDGWRLDAISRYGKFNLLFDSQLRMVELRMLKTGADLAGETPLSQHPASKPSIFFPGGKTVQRELKLTIDERGYWHDIEFPSAATVTETKTLTGGTVTVTYRMRLNPLSIGPPPASAFQITVPIAEGAPVQVVDRPNIEYVWRGGEIVKEINPNTVARLRDRSYFSAFNITGYFVVFAVLLLTVLGLTSWVRHRMA